VAGEVGIRLDPDPLRGLARSLRKLNTDLSKGFSKEMRHAIQPVVDAEKKAALSAGARRGASPSRRKMSRVNRATGWRPQQNPRGSLRHALAASIRQDTALSGGKMTRVGVKMSGTSFARSLRSQRGRSRSAEKLPRYIEGDVPRWRHPMMGQRQEWHASQPMPFFRDTGKAMTPQVVAAMGRVMESYARRIPKGWQVK